MLEFAHNAITGVQVHVSEKTSGCDVVSWSCAGDRKPGVFTSRVHAKANLGGLSGVPLVLCGSCVERVGVDPTPAPAQIAVSCL